MAGHLLPPICLAPGGVYLASRSPGCWCALTAPLHPYPTPLKASGGLHFCGTFLGVASTGCYPAPCPVELGLSSCEANASPAAIRLTHMHCISFFISDNDILPQAFAIVKPYLKACKRVFLNFTYKDLYFMPLFLSFINQVFCDKPHCYVFCGKMASINQS